MKNTLIRLFFPFVRVLAKYNTMIKGSSMYKEKKKTPYLHECLIRDFTDHFNPSFRRTQNKFHMWKVWLSLLALQFPTFVPPWDTHTTPPPHTWGLVMLLSTRTAKASFSSLNCKKYCWVRKGIFLPQGKHTIAAAIIYT